MSKSFAISITPRELFAIQEISKIDINKLSLNSQAIESLLNEQFEAPLGPETPEEAADTEFWEKQNKDKELTQKDFNQSKKAVLKKINSSSGQGYDWIDFSFLISLLSDREIKSLSKESDDYTMPQDRLVSRGAGQGGRVQRDLTYEDLVDNVAYTVDQRFKEKADRSDLLTFALLPISILLSVSFPLVGVPLLAGEYGIALKAMSDALDSAKIAAFKGNIIEILNDMRGIFAYYKPQSQEELVSITNSLFPKIKKELTKKIRTGKVKAIDKSRMSSPAGEILLKISSIADVGLEGARYYDPARVLRNTSGMGKGPNFDIDKEGILDLSDEEEEKRNKVFRGMLNRPGRKPTIIQRYKNELKNVESNLKDIHKILKAAQSKKQLDSLARSYAKLMKDAGYPANRLRFDLKKVMRKYENYGFSNDDDDSYLPELTDLAVDLESYIKSLKNSDSLEESLQEIFSSSGSLLSESAGAIVKAIVARQIKKDAATEIARRKEFLKKIKKEKLPNPVGGSSGRQGADGDLDAALMTLGLEQFDDSGKVVGLHRMTASQIEELDRTGTVILKAGTPDEVIIQRKIRRRFGYFDDVPDLRVNTGGAFQTKPGALQKNIKELYNTKGGKEIADDVDAALLRMNADPNLGDEVVLTYKGADPDDVFLVTVKKGEGLDDVQRLPSSIPEKDLGELLEAGLADAGRREAAELILTSYIRQSAKMQEQVGNARYLFGLLRASGKGKEGYETIKLIPIKKEDGTFLTSSDGRVFALHNKIISGTTVDPTRGIFKKPVVLVKRSEAEATQRMLDSWNKMPMGVFGETVKAMGIPFRALAKAAKFGFVITWSRPLGVLAALVAYGLGLGSLAALLMIPAGKGITNAIAAMVFWFLGMQVCALYKSDPESTARKFTAMWVEKLGLATKNTDGSITLVGENPLITAPGWLGGGKFIPADVLKKLCGAYETWTMQPVERGPVPKSTPPEGDVGQTEEEIEGAVDELRNIVVTKPQKRPKIKRAAPVKPPERPEDMSTDEFEVKYGYREDDEAYAKQLWGFNPDTGKYKRAPTPTRLEALEAETEYDDYNRSGLSEKDFVAWKAKTIKEKGAKFYLGWRKSKMSVKDFEEENKKKKTKKAYAPDDLDQLDDM